MSADAEVQALWRRTRAAGEAAVCALLFEANHSTPRPPGARLLITAAGAWAGGISMGCVENDLRAHARAILADGRPRVVEYGPEPPDGLGVGLTCGGTIRVLLTRWEPATPVPAAWAALDTDQEYVLLTAVAGPDLGAQMLVRGAEPIVADTGVSVAARAQAPGDAAAAARAAAGGLLELGGGRWFYEAQRPPPRLAIVGATGIGQALCTLAAQMGWAPHVVDPRGDWLDPVRFPGARTCQCGWPDEILPAWGLDASWLMAVVGHEARMDLPALSAGLRANCRYLGLLGGARTQAARRAALAQAGFAPAQIARIEGPIGLNLGGMTPMEIALSITAAILWRLRNEPTGVGSASTG